MLGRVASLVRTGLTAIIVLAGVGVLADREPHATRAHAAAPRRGAAHRVPVQTARRIHLGRSASGSPIDAVELGDPTARRKVLVVGCIHGNETAGIAVARRLAHGAPLARVDLWLLEDLNPDGVAAGTRQNGHGVDLNRNFPWHWQPLGAPGTQQYSGTRALSEPESRIAHALISRLRPAVTIWFHQPLAVVDDSGGSPAVERRFARLAGLPFRRLTRYPGSAASWQDRRFPRTTAFVVELPAGRPGAAEVTRYARAVEGVAAANR
jgi:protein MpaA